MAKKLKEVENLRGFRCSPFFTKTKIMTSLSSVSVQLKAIVSSWVPVVIIQGKSEFTATFIPSSLVANVFKFEFVSRNLTV